MIACLQGELFFKSADKLIVMVGGVGATQTPTLLIASQMLYQIEATTPLGAGEET